MGWQSLGLLNRQNSLSSVWCCQSHAFAAAYGQDVCAEVMRKLQEGFGQPSTDCCLQSQCHSGDDNASMTDVTDAHMLAF